MSHKKEIKAAIKLLKEGKVEEALVILEPLPDTVEAWDESDPNDPSDDDSGSNPPGGHPGGGPGGNP